MSETTQVRPPRQRKPAERRVECYPGGVGTAAQYQVIVWTGDEWSSYWLNRIPSDFGTCYEFAQSRTNPKLTGYQSDTYAVCLDGECSSCECPGFLRWGTECKHLFALRTL